MFSRLMNEIVVEWPVNITCSWMKSVNNYILAMHNEGLLKGRTSWRQPPLVLEWWWGLCKGSLPLHSLCKLIPIRIIMNQPVTLTITLETGGSHCQFILWLNWSSLWAVKSILLSLQCWCLISTILDTVRNSCYS